MKRGSALLIVLGMIAFMVISAVAFSAFMRNSRLPSSYLRRTSYSRLLVKAALAEAIDLIDVSIGDNPHPGVGTQGYPYPRRSTANESSSTRQRNYWVNRVFIGTNGLMNASDTVSTLTFEALAYLPPALINETRYYSRRSAAACWHNLGFDSGRYAFTAVDVSDHFDINRTVANVGRNSSDAGKISLAYAFENAKHTEYTVKPSAWDTFMDQFVDAAKAIDRGGSAQGPANASKLPLVSLADFNLAVNEKGWAQNMSPFCRYVTSKGSQDFVVSTGGADSEMMRNMLFVTDGFYGNPAPASDEADGDYDLNDAKYQPFRRSDLESVAGSCATPLTYSSDGVTRLYDSLCGLGLIGLWDYLDTDNVPLSLAVPTVERVPMVCAIEPKFGSAKLSFAEKNADDGQPEKLRVISGGEEGAKKRTVQRTLEYRLDGGQFTAGIMGGKLKVLYAFPFLRDEDANDSFTVGGKVSLFFSDKSMTLRTGNANDALHLVRNDLGNSSVANPAGGVFNIPLQEKSLPVSGVKDEESALKDTITFGFNDTGAATKFSSWLGANPVFRVTKQWEQTREEKPGGIGFTEWEPQNPDDNAAVVEPTECLLPPLLANGSVNENFTSFSKFKGIAAGAGPEVTLRMCVWLYVKNSEGKVVDLVPACMKDDDQLLSKNNFATMGPDGTTIGGTPYPLMMFSGATIGYAPNSVAAVNGQDAGIEAPGAFMCSDPRWNWAPEHWFAMPGGFGKQNWLDNCQRDKDGRDCDIFMATSDAGYMQSVYELAFLPRLTNLESSGASKRLGDTEAVSVSRTTLPANFEETRNRAFMWRTYRPFADNGVVGDDFVGVGFTSRGRGPRVNPFADSETAILAALANTPTSWMVASTNENAKASVPKSERKAENFNKNYCFNMMGPTENRFEWDDLTKIAANLKTAMRRDDGDWERGYRELAWEDESNEDVFAGAELSGSTVDLYDVDRKFLYGYWHDCFAPKQQLFLVFVRAEPMMMGGGAIGQTPPQLGARAVALVWRDPVKRGSEDGDPHSTRILFYRQFD